MRRIAAIIILAIVLGSGTFGTADDKVADRTAIVEDAAGVSTEVKNPCMVIKKSRYSIDLDNRNYIAMVISDSWEIAIPVDQLISITSKEGKFETKYKRNGEETVLLGQLCDLDINIVGESDFGHFRLPSHKLKQLTFKDTPLPAPQKKESQTEKAILVVKNDTKLLVKGLVRYFENTSHESEFVGGSGRSSNFIFQKGESFTIVPFKNLKSIQFGTDKEVTIMLKNGKSYTGKFSDIVKERSLGFCGISDKGNVFVKTEKVKSIEFEED